MKFYLPINYKMDIITIALIEKHIGIPFDVVRYLNEFVKYEKLTKYNIRKAINLWFKNKQLCIFKYNHISFWNVSNVTSMYALFYNRKTFNEDISKWNVSNVQDMSGMFCGAESFNSDISKWNVSNVIHMSYMFTDAKTFQSNISQWSVSNVQKIHGMFYNTQITIQHIDNWNISQTLKNDAFEQ